MERKTKASVRAQEGSAMLADPKALSIVIDGLYADLLAAEDQAA
jgi:hypothetical protein